MKNKFLALTLMLAVLATCGSGCATDPGGNTIEGTLLGGAIGAGAGAAIGSHNHRTGTGALIGGIAGAILGSMIGNDMDAQKKREEEQRPPPPPRPVVVASQPLPPQAAVGPVTFEDIKAMTKQGLGDDTIINHIRQTRTVFRMTASNIIELKNAGVSEKVINFMMETPTLFGSADAPPSIQYVEVEEIVPVQPPPRRYEAPPPCPSSVHVWVDGRWSRHERNWVWMGGRWEVPPRGCREWESGRWTPRRHDWVYVPGHWR